jgi:hypothetical protein
MNDRADLFGRRGTPMQYMLLLYIPTEEESGDALKKILDEHKQFTRRITTSGQYLDSNALEPAATATTVRLRDAKTLVTDGPFAETREQLGGYYLVEAENLDAAIGLAARIPVARNGSVEIRPVNLAIREEFVREGVIQSRPDR